jgi:hypothetical protein
MVNRLLKANNPALGVRQSSLPLTVFQSEYYFEKHSIPTPAH